MTQFPEVSIQQLLRETDNLVSLPEICLKLQKIMADPAHTHRDIARLIMYDPALTSRVLRIVNSAWYGLAVPVSDITHALSIIGEQALKQLVLATSFISNSQQGDLAIDINAFWRTSIFCAVLCRNIAERCQYEQPEELFIAGLLLDIGKLPLSLYSAGIVQAITEINDQIEQDELQIEVQLLGFSHADLGAVMARNWSFPDLITRSIALHHDAVRIRAETLPCRICHVAGSLSEDITRLVDPEAGTFNLALPIDAHASLLELPATVLEEIVTATLQDFQLSYQAFFSPGFGDSSAAEARLGRN